MLNLILAVINVLVGLYFISTISRSTPGFFFVLFISIIVGAVGFFGVIFWFWNMIENKKDSWTKSFLKNWRQFALGIDLLLIVGFAFRVFIVQPFLVEGSSMEPSFHNNEFILVDRISFRFKAPVRGEVIVFEYPNDINQDYIKRIIGVPGDVVTISDNKVYVNGKLLDETYLTLGEPTIAPANNGTPFTKVVAENEYFVLGDNRTHSSDSREWGFVPKANIIGKSWLIVFPFEDIGFVKNPNVFGKT